MKIVSRIRELCSRHIPSDWEAEQQRAEASCKAVLEKIAKSPEFTIQRQRKLHTGGIGEYNPFKTHLNCGGGLWLILPYDLRPGGEYFAVGINHKDEVKVVGSPFLKYSMKQLHAIDWQGVYADAILALRSVL